jgi:hypothetical protein
VSLETRLRDAARDLHRSVEHFEAGTTDVMVRRQRRGRIAGAVAFSLIAAAIIVGTALFVSHLGGEGDIANQPSVSSIVETPTTTVAAIHYPVARAEEDVAALYSLFNDGDVDGLLSRFRAEPTGDWPGVADAGWERALAIAIEGAEAELAVECDPGVPTTTDAVEIRCFQQIVEDRFYAPAGVSWTTSVVYEIDATGIVPIEGSPIWVSEPTGAAREYLVAFDQWLLERHQGGQEVSGWIWLYETELLPNQGGTGSTCCPYPLTTATAARRVFDLVPEFLAEPGDPWPASD